MGGAICIIAPGCFRYVVTIDCYVCRLDTRNVYKNVSCLSTASSLLSLCTASCFKAILCVAKAFCLWYRLRRVAASTRPSRKEVVQPHLPVRLPCYDLAPFTCLSLGRSFRSRTSVTRGSHGLTGGVYKARERIHRAVADARLLANPASWSRVADSNPN